MNWTQEKLEKLYAEVNERAAKDPAFLEKVTKNTKAALEEIAGCSLPDDLGLKYIEKDNHFNGDYVIPDFADGEIDPEEMRAAAGGVGGTQGDCAAYSSQTSQKNNISIALIISICAAAVQAGPDAGLCGAAACAANSCLAEACGAKVCGGDLCVADAEAVSAKAISLCGGNVCGAEAVGAELCAIDASGAEASGAAFCFLDVNAENACAVDGEGIPVNLDGSVCAVQKAGE